MKDRNDPDSNANCPILGIAADHGGFELKSKILEHLTASGQTCADYGAYALNPSDDYPDFVIPLARALGAGKVSRGVAICASGVGVSIASNKVAGVRAALVSDLYTARQGVEDDDLNMLCLGGVVTNPVLAWELVETFLASRFKRRDRFERRLDEVAKLENPNPELKTDPGSETYNGSQTYTFDRSVSIGQSNMGWF